MAVVKEKQMEPRENVLVRTFREVRSEMKKVVWPTREETIRLTVVVIAISILISIILGASDFLFTYLITVLRDLVA